MSTIDATADLIFHSTGDYHFTINSTETKKQRGKQVYIGCFSSEHNSSAPAGCELDTVYCLKSATLSFPLDTFQYPQHRHFWDFLPIEGENLRQVLALNSDAEQMRNDYRNGIIDPYTNFCADKTYHCMVIEPKYEKLDPDTLTTPREIIDCLQQIVKGLKQLAEAPLVQNAHIVAHRDLKLKNVMVETKANGERVMRLIDFPTVKTQLPDQQNDNDTVESVFSPTNTAPEDVLTNGIVTEKTDVFALGCMLAELFHVWSYGTLSNPLHILFDEYGVPFDDFGQCLEQCRRFYEEVLNSSTLNFNPASPCWMEQLLEKADKSANWSMCGAEATKRAIQTLFRRATLPDPHVRCSLRDFESGLLAVYRLLPDLNPQPMMRQKTTYLLIDLTDLDRYQSNYLSIIEQMMRDDPSLHIDMIFYPGIDAAQPPLQPSSVDLETDGAISSFDRVAALIRAQITHKVRGTENSPLKSFLYELARFFEHRVYARDFNGTLHVFAPTPPTESNMHPFQRTAQSILDANRIEQMTAADICNLLGDTQIIVHSTNGATDDWYQAQFFTPVGSSVKHIVPDPPTPPENTDPQPPPSGDETDTPQKKRFRFVGATHIKKVYD